MIRGSSIMCSDRKRVQCCGEAGDCCHLSAAMIKHWWVSSFSHTVWNVKSSRTSEERSGSSEKEAGKSQSTINISINRSFPPTSAQPPPCLDFQGGFPWHRGGTLCRAKSRKDLEAAYVTNQTNTRLAVIVGSTASTFHRSFVCCVRDFGASLPLIHGQRCHIVVLPVFTGFDP